MENSHWPAMPLGRTAKTNSMKAAKPISPSPDTPTGFSICLKPSLTIEIETTPTTAPVRDRMPPTSNITMVMKVRLR